MFWVWLVVIQLFIFTMLVFFLRVLLTRNISSATTHLHELNQDYNEKVEAANKKKAEVDRYYDEMLLKAKADAEKQKVQILREAQATQEAVIKDARRQGEEIIAQANKAQEMALVELDARVEVLAKKKASELMAELLTSPMIESLHRLWVDELLQSGLDDAKKLHLPDELSELQVRTAFPLDETRKKTLQTKLQAALGKSMPVAEEVVPDLIAGIQIHLGSLIIDGSLKYKIQEIGRDVKL